MPGAPAKLAGYVLDAVKGGGERGRVRVGVGEGGGKLAGYVLDMGKGDAEKGRVLDGGLSLFLVLGDQQQLVSFV